ncbi:hypothetical protein [Amycolatopsis rubida]|uniref:Uncharacterized protein n=1 Tax=Amycolatopsis rubida TaxID=112413 RepID=A0A1I5DZK4_9PSEU|nr:hypothetical protein [Amycolatopsis rubida]SFO04597.1 hypothetical protein SAMN05421854_101422 [Amycolatopsis rubida]
MALFPPGAEPVLTRNTALGDVVTLPEEAVKVLRYGIPEPVGRRDECVIALVVVPAPARAVAFAVGPFDKDRARQWLSAASMLRSGRDAECRMLPIRRLGAPGASCTPDPSRETPVPAVVLLDTSDGPACYGPFDSSTDAALFWRDAARVLDPGAVRHARVCDLTPPVPDTTAGPASWEELDDDRVRGWAVCLPSGQGAGTDVGREVVGLSACPFRSDLNTSRQGTCGFRAT